jgi:hypothetical protein
VEPAHPPVRPSAPQGIALVTTLGVLVLLLILTTGAAHLAMGDARRGFDGRAIAISAAAADAGAYSLLRDWGAFDFDSMAVGDTIPSTILAAGDGWAVLRGRRVSPLAWWFTSTGYTPDTTSALRAERAVSVVLRQAIPDLQVQAVFTAAVSVTVRGTGQVVGSDTTTGVWGASCAPGVGAAGIAVADTATVRHGTVTGTPPLMPDPLAAQPATYGSFGAATWASLSGRATVSLPGGAVVTPSPSVVGTACDRTSATNWGEPQGTGACASHAPVIRVNGDLELRGGRGQGVLLVDGDLRVTNGAEFHGVVITRDDVLSGPGGGRVFGVVLAADSLRGPGDHSDIGDALTLRYASCTAAGVLRRSAPLVPVRHRAWAPMQ